MLLTSYLKRKTLEAILNTQYYTLLLKEIQLLWENRIEFLIIIFFKLNTKEIS